MKIGRTWKHFERSTAGQWTLFGTGVFLVALSPIVAPIPGPGGIPVFLAGATLMLRYSVWAKRRYVHLKRRWPRQGHWVDRGLRRASARRRAELARRASGPGEE